MLNNINMPNLHADQHLNFANHMSGGNDDAMGMFSLFYGLPGHYYDDIRNDKTPPVLFDEMLRQDYQFGLFGALEDAKKYRRAFSPACASRCSSPSRPTTPSSSATGSSGSPSAPRTDPGSRWSICRARVTIRCRPT
jgi:membrane-anchored protein YejM (alkaline phosphatase superfamily)